MSVLIAKTIGHISFFPYRSGTVFSAIPVSLLSAMRIRVLFRAPLVFAGLALVALVSMGVYVISMNLILVEGKRVVSLERELREEQEAQKMLAIDAAALHSPAMVKERAAAMGMVEVGQVRFVTAEEVMAAAR